MWGGVGRLWLPRCPAAPTSRGSPDQCLAATCAPPPPPVNRASACGFTPQYEELQALYNKYKSKGFVVAGFPCNQVGWV